jgi:diaminohydroxyphosphoribosylaminopyrimidine deaminase/5-amino-6-(5-phosphoribosylamino)uracil reductase
VASEAVAPFADAGDAPSEETPPSALPGISTTRGEIGNATPADIQSRQSELEAAGVEVLYCNPYHPEVLLPALASRGISSLIVEGGARTARIFLDAGLVDRILLYQGPATIGDGGIESPLLATDMPSDFRHVATRQLGDDRCDEFERGF